ncbi:MAG: hypothetical protein ABJP45_18000 [Cyclobacteriaceae bacterium]
MARYYSMLSTLTNLVRHTSSIACFLLAAMAFAQSSPNVQVVSIEKDENFNGFELLEVEDKRVFVLAEHWHSIRTVPRATMKLIRYLHERANVRILAIEQGASAAHMINQYLSSGDSLTLRQIARNTMFWGQENYAFLQDLYEFNQSLPKAYRVFVKSIDIEYKMESAVFVINDLIGSKEIPQSLSQTVGVFEQMFEDTRTHREQFDGLSVLYYYDRDFTIQLVSNTLEDIENRSSEYENFFGVDFEQFSTMITDMRDGLTFDYTNPNTNYKFRDDIIHSKFKKLLTTYPDEGVLCVIGMRHVTKGSSIYKLDSEDSSPAFGKVMKIRVSALFKNTFKTSDLRRINFSFPKQLKERGATLIKHDPSDPALRSAKFFDYTLFLNDNGELTPFENVLTEGY